MLTIAFANISYGDRNTRKISTVFAVYRIVKSFTQKERNRFARLQAFATLIVDNCKTIKYNCGMKKDVEKLNTPQLFLCKLVKPMQKVYPTKRQAEIDSCANDFIKAEKYTSWQLLKYAIERVSNVPFEQLNLHKNQNGKWVCDEFFFSISHSDELCAVVVDKNPVGVDLQAFTKGRFDKRLFERIATDNEKHVLAQLNVAKQTEQPTIPQQKQILALWCKKEALFKRLDFPTFVARNVDTATAHFVEIDVDALGKIIAQSTKATSTAQLNVEKTSTLHQSIIQNNEIQTSTIQNNVVTTSITQGNAMETSALQNDMHYHIAIATDSNAVTTTWVELE